MKRVLNLIAGTGKNMVSHTYFLNRYSGCYGVGVGVGVGVVVAADDFGNIEGDYCYYDDDYGAVAVAVAVGTAIMVI